MDQSISLRYMRTVQQLDKKKEEVGKLLQDAKALDLENAGLRQQLADCQLTIRELETRCGQKDSDMALLEATIKKQQQRIQAFINREATQPNIVPQLPEVIPPPPPPAPPVAPAVGRQGPTEIEKRLSEDLLAARAEVSTLNSKLMDSEKERVSLQKDLQLSEGRCRAAEQDSEGFKSAESELRAQCDNLRSLLLESERKEASYRAALHHLNERQVGAARDAMEMEDVEARALEGLRAEINVLEGENSHLREALQEERTQYRAARSEFEKSAQLLAKQKALHDAHQAISAEEIRALTLQTEAMLQDMRSATARDGLRRQLEEMRLQERTTPAVSPPKQRSSAVVVTEATAQPAKEADTALRVLEGQLTGLQRRCERLEASRDELAAKVATLQAENGLLTRQRDELDVERSSLKGNIADMKLLLKEHEDTTNLRREKDDLQSTEVARLGRELREARGQLLAAEDRLKTPLMGGSTSDGEHVREAVSQCLVLATTLYHLLQTCLPEWSGGDRDEGSTTRIPHLSDPSMQAAFDEAFGLRFVLQRAKLLAKAVLQSQYAPTVRAATPTVSLRQHTPTTHNVENLREVHHTPSVTPTQRSRSNVRSSYTEGTSLKEVVSEYSRQSPRHHVRFNATRVNMRDGLSLAHWSGRRDVLGDQ